MTNWVDEFHKLNPSTESDGKEVKNKKENSLSLSSELLALDMQNKSFYSNLSEDQKKEIGLWVLMRFMSSSQGYAEHHLTMVNDLVNVNFSAISKHPELQWKLLALCGTNRKQYHPWIAPPKGVKKSKIEEEILKLYPLLKDDELELLFQINTIEEFEELFKNIGYDDKLIKELFKK